MSLAEDFRFHVTTCLTELPRVADDLRWAQTNGYWRSGRWIDSERGADLAKTEAERDAGPRFDVSVGDHSSRLALQASGPTLARVEVHLAAALHSTGVALQPPLMHPGTDSLLPCMLAALQCCVWRAEKLRAVVVPRISERDHVAAAAGYVTRQRKLLISALGRGRRGGAVATAEPMCRICKIRPRADKAGGRCNTCATWFHRNSSERPTSLDRDLLVQPHEAKARRSARGEGWGDESFSAALRRARSDGAGT